MNAKRKNRDGQENEAANEAKGADTADGGAEAEAVGADIGDDGMEAGGIEGDALDAEAIEGDLLEGAQGAEGLLPEADSLKNQLLRMTADFDNYRKRMQRDKQEWTRYAAQGIMEKLLPVLDNLDAASQAVASAGQEAGSVVEGFMMIHKQLTDVLGNEGLTEILALGLMFDPNVHEAVMAVERAEGQQDNEVVMVLRKGYMYKDKVLRPAMVQVAKA